MRYSESEKQEIIALIERSSLSVRRTLAQVGIPKSTFYGWYSRYLEGGPEALEDRKPAPGRVWTTLPAKVRVATIELALAEPARSARDLAILFTERHRYFVSEATVYRLLKAHDLITSPAFIVLKPAKRFIQPTTAPNQL